MERIADMRPKTVPTEMDDAFRRLKASSFRRKFHLQDKERAYLETWGLPHVMKQAADLVAKGHLLTADESDCALRVIERWLEGDAARG